MKGHDKRTARQRRQERVRQRVRGTDRKPRLCVYRSNRHMYAQVISDESNRTLAAASTLKAGGQTGNRAAAKEIGEQIARMCLEKNVREVVFDRNGFLYHGRVREVADAARAAGLKF